MFNKISQPNKNGAQGTRKYIPYMPKRGVTIIGLVLLWIAASFAHHAIMSVRESYAEALPPNTIQFVNAQDSPREPVSAGLVDNLNDFSSQYGLSVDTSDLNEITHALSGEKDTPTCTVFLGIEEEGKETTTIEYCGEILPAELQVLLNQSILLGEFFAGTNYSGAVLSYVTLEATGCYAGTYGQPSLPSGWDNKISSFRVYSNAGCNWGTIYKNTGYSGDSITAYEAGSLGFMDNQASSVRIGH